MVAVQSGFLLVNQQAAHERILYEKSLEDLRKPGRFSAQQLLFPELVELTAAEAALVEERLPELRALGFDLEPFGGDPPRAWAVVDHLLAQAGELVDHPLDGRTHPLR